MLMCVTRWCMSGDIAGDENLDPAILGVGGGEMSVFGPPFLTSMSIITSG